MDTTILFELEHDGQTVILTPRQDLREFEFGQIEVEGSDVLQMLGDAHAKNIVVDFRNTDYYGSTALGFFVKLWKRVREAGGRMAFCNVSAHEIEILQLTKLDSLWKICGSREEAIAEVSQ